MQNVPDLTKMRVYSIFGDDNALNRIRHVVAPTAKIEFTKAAFTESCVHDVVRDWEDGALPKTDWQENGSRASISEVITASSGTHRWKRITCLVSNLSLWKPEVCFG